MRRRHGRKAAALALFLLLMSACAGEQIEKAEEPLPSAEVSADDEATGLRATLSATPSRLHVGDRVQLVLEATVPEGVRLLDPPGQVPPLLVLDRSAGEEGTRWHWEASVFSVGPISVEPMPLTFLDAAGEERTLEVGPLELEVLSVLAEGDEMPADIRGPVLPPLDLSPAVAWGAAGLADLLLLALGIWLWSRLPGPAREPEPEKLREPADLVALRRLDGLRAKGPPPPTQAKPYYVEMSEAIREYVEGRLEIDALERTTEELAFLLKRIRVNQRLAGRLVQWLVRCDLVKFARQRPESSQVRADLEEAYGFIRETSERVPEVERKEAV